MSAALSWLRTVRRVKPSMLVARLRRAVKRGLRRAFPGPAAKRLARVAASAPGLRLGPFAGFFSPGRAGVGREDEFDLGRRTVALPGGELDVSGAVEWGAPRLSRHARYALHGFAWLESVARAAHGGARAGAWAFFRGLLADWIRAHPLPLGDAWDPYPLSVRAVSWLKCGAAFERETAEDGGFRLALARSLYAQGSFLERNVEWHLRLNHLVENARALLFLGCAFGGARALRWRAMAFRILHLASTEQFFPDGCHMERSFMYHLLVLEDLLDCVELVQACGETPPPLWVDAVSRGAGFAKGVLHPDGDIPLINDSALGEARAPGVVVERARAVAGDARPRVAPSKSGFAVLRAGEVFLIIDGGAPSPPYNPAHSHAGALSYELSVAGRRAVVDAGVGGYAEDGPSPAEPTPPKQPLRLRRLEAGATARKGGARAYCRGTRAHNTVCVGGGNQSEMWASFRIGGRAGCFLSDVKKTDLMTSFSGRCRWTGGRVVHSREWVVVHDEGVLVLDTVSGAGAGPVESLIHFAPEWRVERTGRRRWRCESGECVFSVIAFEPWTGGVEDCRVWRRFGREERSSLLALRTEGDVRLGAYFIALRPHDAIEFRPSGRVLVLDGWAYNC